MNRTITIIIIILLIAAFLYLNPIGIKIGYKLCGGESSSVEPTMTPAQLLQEYKEQHDAYYLYRDSENYTAKKWAENAKQNANEIADTYNELFNEKILDYVGD